MDQTIRNRWNAAMRQIEPATVLGTGVSSIVSLSQDDYDNLDSKDGETLYVIV